MKGRYLTNPVRSVFNDCYSCSNSAPLVATAYKREILLSYRLIFGQSSSVRKFFNRYERRNACVNSLYDPLLNNLCGLSTPKGLKFMPNDLWQGSCKDFDGNLAEQDVYSIEADFPLLGKRLLALQTFNRVRVRLETCGATGEILLSGTH